MLRSFIWKKVKAKDFFLDRLYSPGDLMIISSTTTRQKMLYILYTFFLYRIEAQGSSL